MKARADLYHSPLGVIVVKKRTRLVPPPTAAGSNTHTSSGRVEPLPLSRHSTGYRGTSLIRKRLPLRTSQKGYDHGPAAVVLGGVAVSYEWGTPVQENV